MSSVNKVILLGRLGSDPEVNGSVTSLSVATSETWNDKQTGEKKERTEWSKVTLFARLGEVAAQYLHKGSQVYIEGSLRTDKYQDKKTGEDKYSTNIVAREMKMLGGKSDSQNSAPQSSGGSQDFDDNVPF